MAISRNGGPNYTPANMLAAAVILADVERHGGEDAGLVRWAAMVIARQARASFHSEKIADPAQQTLFDMEVAQ